MDGVLSEDNVTCVADPDKLAPGVKETELEPLVMLGTSDLVVDGLGVGEIELE